MGESRFHVWVGALRPRTLPAAVAPVLVGSALAWRNGGFVPAASALCLGFALLVQIGTNFANDYYDFLQGADTPARVGPRRAVAAGLVTPAAMRGAMIAVFAGAFVLGLGLVPYGGPWLIVIGVVSILAGYAYTGGPYPLGYHGLGDLFVFIFFGLVAVSATYFVQVQRLTAEVWIAAVPIGLLAANILVVNNYRDVATDAAAGKRTLVVRWGRSAARVQFCASLVVAGIAPAVLVGRGFAPWALLPWMLAPMAWNHCARLRAASSPAELIRLLGDTGRLLALYAGLLAAGIVW